MSSRCDVCSKQPSFGKRVARSGSRAQSRHVRGRSSRRFNPNIQSVRAVKDGTPLRMNVCTSCIKAGKVDRRVSA
ncbi:MULTISPECIES: 50S ribosomal protein L28 [Streptomyces]|nr:MULTISPECIES: 50S ribosomal protein L28 [Streptomyces]MBB5107251.1 large subunit ribosomal protein L28 [Streptomyces spectabilis]MCI3899951.1 50S ribosomal protein L28 [Streptomyces spectabilis]GGV36375.1 50S ribosomal protein L28-1 [Streptomyces spectabilis]